MAIERLIPQSTPYSRFEVPYILSMGPQRCGTSWLDRYLRSRGDVCLPLHVKETFFFDKRYYRGFDFYKNHFYPAANHNAVMEVSTTSFDVRAAPARVYSHFGQDIKLLCPLRHPVYRSYSLYKHYRRYGMVHGSLQEACSMRPQIIHSSRYARHLKSWFSYFDPGQIKLVFQEDLDRSPDNYLKNICNYLELPFIAPSPELQGKYNVTTESRSRVLATVAQNTADFLRDKQLDNVINYAKNLGLKRFVFGKEKPEQCPLQMPAEDYDWLMGHLYKEIEYLEKLVGPIPQWR